jgi:xanthine dehydrogenase small subunit
MAGAAGARTVQFLLNGRRVRVEDARVQTTLLDYIREQGLTGAKEGCGEGECGACNVLVVAAHGEGSAYRAVNSCLLFLPMLDGQEVYTIEALAEDGRLAEAQKAMAEGGGSQCGYCTPGFVMSLFAEQYRPGRTGPCDVRQLGGNLCRCSAYRAIRDAARLLGAPRAGAFLDRLAKPAPRLSELEYGRRGARFSRPRSLAECLRVMREDPQARVVSGATDLGVESNLKFRRWEHLVSLEAAEELRAFSSTAGSVRIGAALPLADVAVQWHDAPPAFREWMNLFASPALRNRATLGGNLATASPIGDSAPLLMALDALVHLAGPGGERTVPVYSFFRSYRQTALEPGGLIVAIEIPKPLPSITQFFKAAKRNLDDISTVAAGLSLDLDSAGRVARARFGFGGVAAIPFRALGAEEAALGRPWNLATVERVQAALEESIRPISDHRGSSEYRLEVSKSLLKKFWWEHREAA